jgi:hypothetical protein
MAPRLLGTSALSAVALPPELSQLQRRTGINEELYTEVTDDVMFLVWRRAQTFACRQW